MQTASAQGRPRLRPGTVPARRHFPAKSGTPLAAPVFSRGCAATVQFPRRTAAPDRAMQDRKDARPPESLLLWFLELSPLQTARLPISGEENPPAVRHSQQQGCAFSLTLNGTWKGRKKNGE